MRRALERVRARCDVEARRAADPVGVVHRYAGREDQELVGLLASSMAFGNVRAIRQKLDELLERVGPSVHAAADEPRALRRRLAGFRHRVYRGDDLARLLIGARAVQREAGSLGHAFLEAKQEAGDLRGGLSAWAARIRRAGKLGAETAGERHLLADAARGSAAKRLLLYLRWMVRPADGVDLGLWELSPAELVIPVDVHIHKLGRNLGLTSRRAASWQAAEDITRALARFDPADPVKYDFALCHLGMLQGCPSKRDEAGCRGCGIRSVCVHWAKRPT